MERCDSGYGYGGPVASHESLPEPVVRNFQAALRAALIERRVLAMFSRLHPLIAQRDFLAGLGVCRAHGQTVSIRLDLPLEEQRAQYGSNVKWRLSNQQREGVVTCVHDQNKHYLSDFVSIYEETMRRVNAEKTYFSAGTISDYLLVSWGRYCSCLLP
jgi:hypothetical protein